MRQDKFIILIIIIVIFNNYVILRPADTIILILPSHSSPSSNKSSLGGHLQLNESDYLPQIFNNPDDINVVNRNLATLQSFVYIYTQTYPRNYIYIHDNQVGRLSWPVRGMIRQNYETNKPVVDP